MKATAVLALTLLLANSLLAGTRNDSTRRHEFRTWLGAGMITPFQIVETNGPTLQRKLSWGYEAGFGYGHQLYKNLSATVAVGVNVYSYKYAADVVVDELSLVDPAFEIRHTETLYTWHASLSLSQKFVLAEKLFSAEGGIRLVRTPSLSTGLSAGVQDSVGTYRRFFNADADFENALVAMYFLKFGTPLFKNTSKLSAHILFNYCPAPFATGNFHVTNSTRDSDGTFKIKGSGMGVELRYSF